MTMPADSTPPANGFDQPLNAVLNTAPELTKSPGLAVGVAQAGGNVVQNAQGVAHATNTISDQNAHASVAAAVGGPDVLQTALDWFGNHVVAPVAHDASVGMSDVGKAISPIAAVANKPMQLVQHEYRYLHDVEARHGATAALLEGIGIAAGAAAGFAAGGGFYGADLGAEAATGIESQMFYKDSWQRTGQASYADPNTHQQVSVGRDIVSELSNVIPGLDRNTKTFKITSGLIDGVFDMNVGGTELLGLAGKANSAEGLAGTLGSFFPGKAPQTTEAFDNLMTSFSGGNVRRAFSDIATKSPGEIAAAYPSLAPQSDLTKMLGNATDEAQVASIFRDIVRTHEMVYFDKLPTLSAVRAPLGTLRDAMGNSSIPGAQQLYRATSRMPTSYDDVAHEWTNMEFNPAHADDGTLYVHRTALFTENQRVAASISEEYANADIPGKIKIWRNLVWSTMANIAGYRGQTVDEVLAKTIQDPEARGMWKEAIDNYINTGMFGKEAKYANGVGGDDISTVLDTSTGKTMAAGVTRNQTGSLTGLDLADVRLAAHSLAQQKNLFGHLDDIAFRNLTAPIFKRWVLLSPSYAFHISLAELIPNTLRLGLTNVAKAKLELHIANTGIKVGEGEASAVAGLAWKMAKGIRNLTPGIIANPTERDLGYLTDFIIGNDGQLYPREIGAGHNLGDEVKPRQENAIDLLRGGYVRSGMKKLGDDFGTFGVGDQQYHDAWQARLHESANDSATQLAAKRLGEYYSHGESQLAEIGPNADRGMNNIYDEVAQHLRDSKDTVETRGMMRAHDNITSFIEAGHRPPGMDAFDEYGRAMVDKVRGETTGVDGTIHKDLLEKIANGETVDDQTLKDIPPRSKPRNISGRLPLPNGDPALQRFTTKFFGGLNRMVNYLSREPIEAAEYIKQRTFLQESVDKGLMTDDEAHVQAMSSSVQTVIKNVHNLTDRTQWTVTFRNFAPFYFAQEQAYRRMGRLLANDPAAFRKYQLMISNMHNVGQVFQGPNGNGYFVIPGTGWMTAGVIKALGLMGVPVEGATPVGMGWNLSSSSVIFPLSAGIRPDIGPLASIPIAAVAQYFPTGLSPILKADFTSAADGILGPTATEALYMQAIPNTFIQRELTAIWPVLNSRAFNSSFMQTLATLDYEGKVPPPGSDYRTMQTFLDRVRLQTQIMYALKGLYGFVTPVSPEITDNTFNAFNAAVTTYIVQYKSVSAGLQAFLAANPDATPFTVWQSSNLTGISIPSSVQAEHWINENYDLISKYPNAGILLMPMTGMSTVYDPKVYNEQIAQSLRAKLAPDQWTQNGNVPSYIDSLYIAGGNSVFYKWLSQFEAQVKGLSGSMKYNADQAFWGNGTLGSGTVGKFGQQNPVWWSWYNSQTRSVERSGAITQMKNLLAANPNLQTPVAQGTRALLDGYQNHLNILTTFNNEHASSTQITDENDKWKNYLINTTTQYPEMLNVVTGLFMSIPTTTAPQVNISNNAPGVFNAQSWNQG